MEKQQKVKSDLMVTIGFVMAMILLRVLSENMDYDVQVIAIINGFMFLYVFYKIHMAVKEYMEARNNLIKIFADQYSAYIRASRWCIGVFVLIEIVYIFLISNIDKIHNAGGCLNDITAIITFCLSLEDDNICEKIKKYFKNKDYTLKKK